MEMTKKTTPLPPLRTLGATLLAGVMLTHLAAAEPATVTNTVTLTNVVTITNYAVVTVTNEILTTNFSLIVSTPEPDRKPTDLPPLNWIPPDDKFDWVQLKSGEWLKGRIKAMQDQKLEFESDELNDQSFDWADVRQLRSPKYLDVLFDDGTAAHGPVTITPDLVKVQNEETEAYPRALLFSMTPGGSRRNYWSGKASVGLTLRAGNTEQVEYSAQARLQRRTAGTRLSLDYIGNVSSLDNVESANNHRVNSEFDLWLSRRLYLVVPYLEYYRDPFQNLDSRITGGVGVGYDILYTPTVEWNVTTGPGYQVVRFDSAQPGEPIEKSNGALTFGSKLDWDITRRLEFILEYRGQYTSKEVGETTHHAVATFSVDVTKQLDLDVSLTWDRISNPKIGADGIEPKPDDLRLIVGLGLDF